MVLTMPRLRNWKGERLTATKGVGKPGDLRAGLRKHPFADRLDDADLLGDRDEERGLDAAALRMLPTDQRLEALDFRSPRR